MAGVRVHTVMPSELVARIDAALSDGVSRGEFVRRAVERALSEAEGSLGCEQAGSDPVVSSEAVRPAAPAEQPVGVEQRPATGVGGGSPGVSKASLPAAAERPVDRAAAFRRATQR